MVKFPAMLTGNWAIRKAFNGLVRRLQTTVEHMRVTNTATAMVRGEVIALTAGVRQAVRAQANAEATSRWAGVQTEPTLRDATGIARINGYAYVLFEEGLDPAPAAGDQAYVSPTTAGRATNVQPSTPGQFVMKMGVVGNGGPYAAENAAYVFLQHCCPPAEIR